MLEPQAQAQIQDFIHVLKKRKWMMLMPCLFFLTLGSAFAVIIPKKYVVETKIEIKPARVSTDYQLRNPNQSAAAREVPNAEHHIKNIMRITKVIEGDLESWPEYHRAGPLDQSEFVKMVRDNLEIDMDEKDKKASLSSTFVKIIYQDPVMERAPRFLNQLRDTWIEDVVAFDLLALKKEHAAYFDQKALAQKELTELESRQFELGRELQIDPQALVIRPTGRPGPDNDFVYNDLLTQRTRRSEAWQSLENAQGQLERLQQMYDLEPPETFEDRVDDGVDQGKDISEALLEITKMEEVRDRLTPLNTRYKEIGRKIAGLEERIADMQANEREGGSIKVAVPNERKLELAKERDEKQTAVAGYEREIRRADELIAELDKEIAGRTKKYEDLHQLSTDLNLARQNYETVSLALADTGRSVAILEEGAGRPYSIAEDAKADPKAVEPNPWFIVFFTGLLGLAFGMFLSLIVEYGHNSYRTVTELAGVMSVPVLGAIEPIVTQAELRRVQFRRAMVGFSTAILVGGVAWVMYMYKFSPERLPVEIQQALDTIELNLR